MEITKEWIERLNYLARKIRDNEDGEPNREQWLVYLLGFIESSELWNGKNNS